MAENKVSNLVTYKFYYQKFKELYNQGGWESVEVFNIALVGIAKDLGVMNPVLL